MKKKNRILEKNEYEGKGKKLFGGLSHPVTMKLATTETAKSGIIVASMNAEKMHRDDVLNWIDRWRPFKRHSSYCVSFGWVIS